MPDGAKCGELLEKVQALLDGELDGAACEKVEAHLRGCPHCEACRDILKKTITLCGGRVELPDNTRASLIKKLSRLL